MAANYQYRYYNNGQAIEQVPLTYEAVAGDVLFVGGTPPDTDALEAAFPGYATATATAEAQAAAAILLANGLTITSTGTPALNGTYGTSPQDEVNMIGLQASVAAGVFPGFLRDGAQVKHTMTGPQLTEIATAILDFIVAVEEAVETVAGGGSWAAPNNAVTIA